jgi:hypothetical protein
VIVTSPSIPTFQLVPLEADDDLIDQLLEHNPAFRELLQAGLREPTVSVKEAANRL